MFLPHGMRRTRQLTSPPTTQAFWAAALEIPEGMYSPEPVRTQWGYHIIKIEGRK